MMSTVTKTLSNWSKQYIGGEWRNGSGQHSYNNQNPFDQSELVNIQLASIEDIDRAYHEAKRVQIQWQEKSPDDRVAIMKKTAEVIENYREEIVHTLIAETGSSVVK